MPTVTSPGFAAAQVRRPCTSQAAVLCGEEANAAWMSLITISGRHVLKQSCDIYIKSNRLCNLCLFAHDCLFDRKSIQCVVWLSVALSATIRFCDLIDGGGAKILSPLAANTPSQICYENPGRSRCCPGAAIPGTGAQYAERARPVPRRQRIG